MTNRVTMTDSGRLSFLTATVWLLILSASVFGSDPPDSYRLGPEDVITLTILGHKDFSGEFLIPVDGSVTLPAIGKIKIAGMTPDEVAAEATERLKDRLIDPEVTVTLRVPRMQRIYVLGRVNAPGQLDAKPGWRIAEAIAAAGGLTPDTEPSDCEVIVMRGATGQKESRNLGDVIRGDLEANLPIESGDVLTVDSGETLPVYIIGRVRSPGLYKVRKAEAGVMEALALAGGTMDDAALSAVRITRLSGQSETIDLSSPSASGRQASRTELQPGDLVFVPETKARVAVLGHVNDPGFYTIRDGEILTLSGALGMANGVDNKRGKMETIAIIRTENGKQQNMVFNMGKFLKEGDVSQNPEIKSGDVVFVAGSQKMDFSTILQAASTVGLLINPFIN